MNEAGSQQTVMDDVLRRSMSARVPGLAPEFDQRVMRELRRGSGPADRYRRILLAGYGLTSAVASAVVMRGQGLNWSAVVGLILASFLSIAIAGWTRRLSRTLTMRGTKPRYSGDTPTH
jgi:hypothetical protein